MDFSNLGFKITVAYEDLSDVWPVISKAIKARLPLHQVTLMNKLGTQITVDHMPVELVSSFEPAVQKLQQYAYSALTWFRQPAASLVLISCNDAEDYKKNFRLQLRAMIDSEGRHPLSPEPVFVYIAPPPSPELDPKGPGRVVDAMRRELGSRRRERVARVDLIPAPAVPAVASTTNTGSSDLGLHGIDDVILCLKAAIAASLEARIGAYGEVVRQHLTALQAARPDACFSDLFLLKDAVAVMMESAGLVEDSVREYLELEVALQQVEKTRRQQICLQSLLPPLQAQTPSQALGVKINPVDGISEPQPPLSTSPLPISIDTMLLEFLNGGLQAQKGVDEATGIWSGWRATRLSVQGIAFGPNGTLQSSAGYGTTVPTAHTITRGDTTSLLALRQAVFASQARVLLKLQRYSEVLQRGLSFFHSSFSTLAALEEDEDNVDDRSVGLYSKGKPKLFKEAWAFAGCVTLAAAVASSSSFSSSLPSSQQQQQQKLGASASQYYLNGVLDQEKETSETTTTTGEAETSDWRLGFPTFNFQEILFNNAQGDLSSSASTRAMYCLLGQLYCTARAQLETLGAAYNLHPPEFKTDLTSTAASISSPGLVSGGGGGGGAVNIHGAAGFGSPGAGQMEDSTGSLRRSLHKARSMSPSRASLDVGSVRSSFLSAAGAGGGGAGHLAGVESGDEASSLSIRIHNQHSSPFDAQENMQTIDLAAGTSGGEGGDGDGDGSVENGNTTGETENLTPGVSNDQSSSGSGVIGITTTDPSASIQGQVKQPLGPMAAAAALNATSTTQETIAPPPTTTIARTTTEMTSAQISADAAEQGVELAPVASVTSFPPAPVPVFPSSSPLAAGLSHHHRRTNTATSTKTSFQASESDSGVSTPRSASAASSVAGAAAGAGAASGAVTGAGGPTTTTTATAATTSTGSQDAGVAMRKIERILDDLWAPLLDDKIDSTTKPSPLASFAAGGGNEDENVWKPVHWRLRRALASQAAFADLWQALTVAAAVCFDSGGRKRQAVQCRAEIADCLATKGQLTDAARLYETQCRIALAEGWTLAAAAHLPKLAACQASLQSPGLPHTAAALLKLTTATAVGNSSTVSNSSSSTVFTASDAIAAVNLLCKAAALPSAALPLPPPLLPPRPQLPGPGAAGTFPFIITDTGMVDVSSVLVAQPVKGRYSKFYCRNDLTGRPILCSTMPTALSLSSSSSSTDATSLPSSPSASSSLEITHTKCAVGDVNVITLQIFSRLPTPIALQDIRLLLLGMQEMTALASPRATSPSQSTAFRPSMQNMPLSSGWSSLHYVSVSTPHQQVPTPSSVVTGKGGGGGAGAVGGGGQQNLFYRADSFADEGPRFTTEWQDTEDLSCSFVSILYNEGSHSQQANDKVKKHGDGLKKKNNTSGSGNNNSSTGTALLTPFVGPVEIRPGGNILRFMAAPVKRGLYRPVRITALLHNLEISIDVEEKNTLSLDTCSFLNNQESNTNGNTTSNGNTSSSMMVGGGGGGIGGGRDQGHFLSSFEDSVAYPIVLEVEPTLPRISVAALSAAGCSINTGNTNTNASGTGCLIAGQKQWIGLNIVPGRDVLENATLAITWPVPPSEVARKMSGMLTSSTSTGIQGNKNNTTAAGGGGVGTLSPELSFITDVAGGGGGGGMSAALLPLHNAALVKTSSTTTEKEKEAILVAASSWTYQDGHQEIALPAAATSKEKEESTNRSGDGMTVWWWIEAGSFVSPSEQVKVLAPGQQLQDGGGGGGGGGDSSAVYNSTGISHQLNKASGGTVPSGSSIPHMMLHLPLYLQYLSGCRRTFSKIVPLSVHHPFTVSTSARELPNGSIVTHFNVSSLLPHAVTVTTTSLALQPGLHLVRDIATELNIFPLTVLPHSVFSLSFIVTVDRMMAAGDRAAAQARLQQAAKMQPTVLQLNYTIGIEESCGTEIEVGGEEINNIGTGSAVYNGAYAGHRTTVHGDTINNSGVNQQHLDNNNSKVPATNMTLPSADALFLLEKTSGAYASVHSSSSATSPFIPSELQQQLQQKQQYQECRFNHYCALELSPSESDIPGAVVLVQLLGPFSAIAGQPISLCWRLERAGAAVQGTSTNSASNSTPASQVNSQSAAAEPLKIQFEIGTQGDTSWRPLGRRSGAVILEPYDGAIATIEATWIPLVAGTVAAPTLRLADVAYQECFEVGSGSTNYLVIMPSPY